MLRTVRVLRVHAGLRALASLGNCSVGQRLIVGRDSGPSPVRGSDDMLSGGARVRVVDEMQRALAVIADSALSCLTYDPCVSSILQPLMRGVRAKMWANLPCPTRRGRCSLP